MQWVIDTSSLASQFLPDESSKSADHFFSKLLQHDTLLVPSLCWYELCNVLVVAVKRKRLTVNQTFVIIDELQTLPLQIEPPIDQKNIIELAQDNALSAYDAAYLQLAIRSNAGLFTLDKALHKVAQRLGIKIFR